MDGDNDHIMVSMYLVSLNRILKNVQDGTYVILPQIKVKGKKVSQIGAPVERNKHFIKFPIFFSTVMLSSLPS